MVNQTNFNTTTLKFSEKYDHLFTNYFAFGNMFPESHGFVVISVTSRIKDTCSNLSLSNLWRVTKLHDLVTCTATKPWLSGNMSPYLKTYSNGWLNFSENWRIVTLNRLELTQLASPNQSIYFNFRAVLWVRCDVDIY